MMSNENQDREMEKKYLIKDEEAFKELLAQLRQAQGIEDYLIGNFLSKKREYRYFDTFEGELLREKILTYIGPLEMEGASTSLRAREGDFVLTVKLPTQDPEEREEYEQPHQFHLPPDMDFYQLSPEEFTRGWAPLKKIKELTGDKTLQEAVRLVVHTNRFDLYKDNERRVEIALDDVLGIGPFNLQQRFFELELEQKEGGTQEDLERINRFFMGLHSDYLVKSPIPKWIKALKLMRGEKLFEE
jgi:hypothetical protein